MSLDRRLCSIAIISLFIATIVVKGSSGLTVPPSPRTSDDFAKKLNQISTPDQLPETGSFLDREAHGRYQRDLSDQARLQIYEVDVEAQTVSVRLTPLRLLLDGVDSYQVLIVNHQREVYSQGSFAVSQELHCKLWDGALCFQNLGIASIRGWSLSETRVKVSGLKNGEKVAGKQWECRLDTDLPYKVPSPPVNSTITYPSPGVVKLQWKHPWFPYTKIQRFQVRLTVTGTSLMESQKVVDVIVDHPGVPERKEYETELQLHPSSRYYVEVVAENLHGFSRPSKHDFTTPIRIDFESAEILLMRLSETLIEFKVPAVINATIDTWVTVTVQGPLNCTNNGSSADRTSIEGSSVVDESKVHENGPRTIRISENGIRHSASTCYLQPGRRYVIKAEAKDKATNMSAVPIESIGIILPGGDGEASAPNVTEESVSHHPIRSEIYLIRRDETVAYYTCHQINAS